MRGWSGALPEEMCVKFPPNASFHFENTSFLAIFNLNSYQKPFFP